MSPLLHPSLSDGIVHVVKIESYYTDPNEQTLHRCPSARMHDPSSLPEAARNPRGSVGGLVVAGW
jgi:hypothetical protein